jgi:hypothetical protein
LVSYQRFILLFPDILTHYKSLGKLGNYWNYGELITQNYLVILSLFSAFVAKLNYEVKLEAISISISHEVIANFSYKIANLNYVTP